MVNKTFQLLLLLSPIVYGININLDKFDIRFFEIGIIALFVASLFDKPKRDIRQFALSISLLLGLLTLNSFWHKFQPQDIRAIELLFFGLIGFVIAAKYLAEPKRCFKYIWWALGINLIILFFQKAGYSPILNYGGYKGCEGAMLGNNAKFGIYLALILPYLPLIAAIILAGIFGLLLPYAQLSILIPLSLLLFFKTKYKSSKIFIVTGSLLTILIFHSKIWASILLRWSIWKPALNVFFKQPLLGWGFGTYQLWTGTESFNSYLPFIYGVGLLGLVWLGYLAKEFKKTFAPDKESLAVLSLGIVSLVEYPFEIPRLWFIIIAVLSFYAIKQIERSSYESTK